MMVNDNNRDIDLYTLVKIHLEREVSMDASKIFSTDLSIIAVINSTSLEQRYIINRYFYNLLLRYRSKSETPVNNVLAMLVADGKSEDWFALFIKFVAPFIKTHRVFEVVYAQQPVNVK